MKNKSVDLRNHLFATLEALQDQEKPMDLDRARTVAAVAHEVIELAKVEVQFLKATGAPAGSGFLDADPPKLEAPKPRAVNGS